MLQFLLGMKNLPLTHSYGSIKALTKSINKSERGHELVIAISCILLGLFLKHFPKLFLFCLGMNVGSNMFLYDILFFKVLHPRNLSSKYFFLPYLFYYSPLIIKNKLQCKYKHEDPQDHQHHVSKKAHILTKKVPTSTSWQEYFFPDHSFHVQKQLYSFSFLRPVKMPPIKELVEFKNYFEEKTNKGKASKHGYIHNTFRSTPRPSNPISKLSQIILYLKECSHGVS